MAFKTDVHVPGLLDETPISGPVAIDRRVSPLRKARIVDRRRYDDTLEAIGQICATWGGAADLLIPADQSAGVEGTWREFLYANAVDETVTRNLVPEDTFSSKAGRARPESRGELLIAALGRRTGRQNWRDCFDPSTVPMDSSWHLAYVASLGLLPPDPSDDELRFHDIIDGTTIRDVLSVDSAAPSPPGAADLLDRIYLRQSVHPVVVSMLDWAAPQPFRGSTFSSEPPMPIKYGQATRFNGNVVVIYSPGDVADLCVAWNLRAIYGHPARAPLAVPVDDDVSGVIAEWKKKNAFTLSGFRRIEIALVSHSVPAHRLEELANQVGHDCVAVPLDVVLRPGQPLERHSSEVVVFDGGHARVPAWTPQDRSEIARVAGRWVGSNVTVRFSVREYPIPPVRALQAVDPMDDRAAHGGAYARTTNPTDVVDLVLPEGWQVLSAACADKGLDATPSTQGHVGARLLHSVDGWQGLLPFLDAKILDLLQGLGQRRGISWFKDRLTTLIQQIHASDDAAGELARKIDALRVSARSDDDDLNEITMDAVREALGGSRNAAEAWLTWAERHELVHRGVDMHCGSCGEASWVPIADMAPPITCRRCGRRTNQPYRYDSVVFRYRASQHLLSVLETDSLPQLLAGRFLISMFGPVFGSGYVYGVYPGVVLRETSTGEEYDADVLALLCDGSLVSGECKRTSNGLKPNHLDKAPAWTISEDPLQFGGSDCLHRFGRTVSALLNQRSAQVVSDGRYRFEHQRKTPGAEESSDRPT